MICSSGLVSCSTFKPIATNFVGYNSDNNNVVVAGPGSAWRLGPICLGLAGRGNAMLVTNGGLVTSTSAFMGGTVGSTSNSVWVNDPGSVWTNTGGVVIGLSGSGNGLTIRHGGMVFAGRDQSSSSVGYNTNSSRNSVLVSDPGSLWFAGASVAVAILAGAILW